jgi:gliding motility-associated-like protein
VGSEKRIFVRKRILFGIWFLLLTVAAMATHNRAGEITYRHISNLTYEFTMVTYTYSLSPADRPTLTMDWGDGTSSVVNRIQKVSLPNQVNMNLYKATHTFAGQGSFVVSMEDPNRNGGVVNIPNSINVPFYIETVLVINPFIGSNNSPVLLNPPIDNGCVGSPFLHNPSAYDPDGDSISYELIHCKGEDGNDIKGYTYPAASQSFSIDPVTGTLSWINPIYQGEYNVAILIKEWRNGVMIGSLIRDMQITIAACNNHPPVIQQPNDTCVLVRDTLYELIKATDQDNDRITLTGTGGPLVVPNNKATFPQPKYGIGSVSSPFQWIPICEHVQKQPYQMVYKAKDNSSPVNLVDIKSHFIKVIAPGPDNPYAAPKQNSMRVTWNKSICSEAIGYDIYRHNGYIGYVPNTCETGVPAWTGYIKVGFTSSWTDTVFTDDNFGYGLAHGPDYCYMIVAVFPDGAESYPSVETCASLIKDVPVITNVSVDTTDKNDGKITVIWSKPDTFDFNNTPGPFKYLVYQSVGHRSTNFTLVDSTATLNDTTIKIKKLNTLEDEYNYRIDFINLTPGNRFVIGSTQVASELYLMSEGKANRVELSWDEKVPWTNRKYVIYKKNASGGWDSLGTTIFDYYTDSNLVNGATYCYKIKSVGEYTGPGFAKPLINWSQEICDVPVDNEPPCAPHVWVSSDCQTGVNTIVWDNPNHHCANDVVSYKLYYRPTIEGDFTEIYFTPDLTDTVYIHQGPEGIVGCYSVTAIDSFNNESAFSEPVCVDIDSCQLYRLPNVFTPNGDGTNDVFHPFPYDFVDHINIKIYNRWGGLVYQTDDPDVNWDGTDMNTGKESAEGVYFYECEVYEYRLEGLKMRELRGTVTLFRKK